MIAPTKVADAASTISFHGRTQYARVASQKAPRISQAGPYHKARYARITVFFSQWAWAASRPAVELPVCSGKEPRRLVQVRALRRGQQRNQPMPVELRCDRQWLLGEVIKNFEITCAFCKVMVAFDDIWVDNRNKTCRSL